MPVYRVTIDDKIYNVEIENPWERPVRAVVNGTLLEVWPEAEAPSVTPIEPAAPSVSTGDRALRPPPQPKAGPGVIASPLPGTIVSISVQEGEVVEPGQEICVLEAMKMNNPIRSTVSGTVEAIHVSVGEQVQHGAPLITVG